MDDNIPADNEIQQLIDAKTKIIEKKILTDVRIGYSDFVAETSFELSMDENIPFESNLGPFVADAIYHQLNSHSDIGVDAVLVAAGVIRNNIYTGKTDYRI